MIIGNLKKLKISAVRLLFYSEIEGENSKGKIRNSKKRTRIFLQNVKSHPFIVLMLRNRTKNLEANSESFKSNNLALSRSTHKD